MIHAGIDYSSFRIDVVLFDEEARPTHAAFELGRGRDAFERVRDVREAMPVRGWWRDEGVVAIGLEEPRGPGNGSLLRIQGAILACLPRELLVVPLSPSQWRRSAGIAGNAPKAAIRNWSLGHGGDAHWPQDAHDAHAIAAAVSALVAVDASWLLVRPRSPLVFDAIDALAEEL